MDEIVDRIRDLEEYYPDSAGLSSAHFAPTSPFYTWEDARCSPEFLASLPTPISGPISSGYGCATLFWLAAHDRPLLKECSTAGTIADFIVCLLTRPLYAPPKVSMTVHNAVSWGYFDAETNRWERSLFGAPKFPHRLLPRPIVPVGSIVGEVKHSILGLRKGVKVLAAVGDFQASLLAAVGPPEAGLSSRSAFINVGTSAQLATLLAKRDVPDLKTYPGVTMFPFSETHVAVVAASLNGGNVLNQLAKMFQEIRSAFGRRVDLETTWSVLLKESSRQEEATAAETAAAAAAASPADAMLKVKPTLYGERHDPGATASISGITASNLSMGSLMRATCRGIIDNLLEMMPLSLLKANGVQRVIASGGVFEKNPVMLEEAKKAFEGMELVLCDATMDASYGAALFTTLGK